MFGVYNKNIPTPFKKKKKKGNASRKSSLCTWEI
jgi:hypothetical protein